MRRSKHDYVEAVLVVCGPGELVGCFGPVAPEPGQRGKSNAASAGGILHFDLSIKGPAYLPDPSIGDAIDREGDESLASPVSTRSGPGGPPQPGCGQKAVTNLIALGRRHR